MNDTSCYKWNSILSNTLQNTPSIYLTELNIEEYPVENPKEHPTGYLIEYFIQYPLWTLYKPIYNLYKGYLEYPIEYLIEYPVNMIPPV